MAISAISSALGGMASAQAHYNAAATSIATGSGDLVDGVIDAKGASVQYAVNIAMLRHAMDADRYLIDVLA